MPKYNKPMEPGFPINFLSNNNNHNPRPSSSTSTIKHRQISEHLQTIDNSLTPRDTLTDPA